MVEASNLTPEANERVRLFVKNNAPESQRIDEVKMNEDALIGAETTVENLFIYEFLMPSEQNAVITIETSDVWSISVAEDVSNYVALSYDSTTLAAEGEVVNFKLASFTGYWYKAVAAVEEDVVLTKNDDGSYSFVMPAHAVTITAVTGENVYAVTAEDTDYYRFNGIYNNETYEVGEEVKFKVNALGYDTVLTGVFVDGVELVADADGYYSFLMPTYGVTLTATYDIVYRTVVGVDSEHFTLSLTTVVNEEEVAAGNNVLAEQVVYVEATEKPTETPHNFIVSGFIFEAGEDADNLYTRSITVRTDAEGREYFTVPTSYKYIKVSIEEVESEFKYSPLVGTYNGYRPYYGGNYEASLDVLGEFKLGSSSKGTLTKVSDNHYTSSNGYSTINYFIDLETNSILYVEGNSNGGSYLFTKTENEIGFDNSAATKVYSYYVTESSSLVEQFYYVTYTDGTVVTCHYNYQTGVVTFGATTTLISGTDGKTVGDVVAVLDAEGNEISRYEVLDESRSGDGWQMKSNIVQA